MTAQNRDGNIPIEIRGYVTDPQLVGYQMLTNYESTYWRALVGNDAWGLFEVLRSFCHHGNDTCTPSISLLTDILGVSDRRHITGRVEVKKGKEYEAPGLIDILQEYGLVWLEITGQGPTMRYIFHVTLTPGMLTDDQLEQLSRRLQKKHKQLIRRITQNQQTFGEQVNRGKTRKQRKKQYEKAAAASKEGGPGESPDPPGESPDPPGESPHRTTPINITHKTTTKGDSKKNNNSSGDPEPQNDVVVALAGLGISKQVAQRLASRYSRERILEKMDYLTYLEETEPGKINNPRGWLRTAIEENYGLPDGYKSKAEREAEAEEKKRRQQEHEAMLAAREAQQSTRTWSEWLTHHEDIPEKLQSLTRQLQDTLRLQMTKATYETWVKNTMIVEIDGEQARIAVQSQMALDWLANRLQKQFSESLQQLINHPVAISFEVIERPEDDN